MQSALQIPLFSTRATVLLMQTVAWARHNKCSCLAKLQGCGSVDVHRKGHRCFSAAIYDLLQWAGIWQVCRIECCWG